MIAAWFLVPEAWPWLGCLPLAVAFGFLRERARRRRVQAALGPRAVHLAGRPAHRGLRASLALGAAACALVALLRPQAGRGDGDEAVPDLLLALDVSWSMSAQDVPPSRFEAAARAVQELVASAGRLRVGLVAFAGEARLLAPLTRDVAAVAALAAGLVPGAELRGGTDLGAAIDAARLALERGRSPCGDIVVLTDAEDFGGTAAIAAATARARGFPVHAIGYGTATGSKIAVTTATGQEFLRDDRGQEVVVALDAGAIDAIARAGGGVGRSAAPPSVLVQLVDERLQPRAEGIRLQTTTGERAHAYQWPLCLGLLLWMLRLLLPERSR